MLWKLGVYILLSATFTANANTDLLQNDREGDSYYSKIFSKSKFKRYEEANSYTVVEDIWKRAIERTEASVCASSIMTDLQKDFDTDYDNFFYLLRKNNALDDIGLNIFQKMNNAKPVDLSLATFNPNNENAVFRFLAKAKRKGFCAEDEFNSLYQDLNPGENKANKKTVLKNLRNSARQINLDKASLNFLEGLLDEEFYSTGFNLKDYLSKKETIRKQYPLLDAGLSSFVTEQSGKNKASIRMELYRKFSHVQLALMGKIITDLRLQLESDRIEIYVYAPNDELAQVIPLDPMERFRFAIAYLRKEIDGLEKNSAFKGLRPQYEDIVAASFELGLTTASEWDEVRGLEEIWNPKRTFWDKASVWGKMILPLTSVLIPPPYGFVSTLGIVAIDYFTMKNKDDSQMTHSLFK